MRQRQNRDDVKEAFRVERNRWYAWQKIPDDLDTELPYYSPVYVLSSTKKRENKSHIAISFSNVLFLDGPQDFHVNLRVLRRYRDFLVADLLPDGEDSPGATILGRISFEWLNHHCPHLVDQYPPSLYDPDAEQDVATYLDRVFPHVRSGVTRLRQPPLGK
ncbi:hypothetical protein SAMN02745148_00471 [Modicisalibacter ilicicola DSM 19980]|uniref:Uncharacterized protein n=2 Tax=Modicisalibacter ilicicola TaxID=480814 RepID=A0A1M4TJY7_9GAMM|nr:hypothetical protein SAMN02745148_00471 [Halomonas ilicicola DSM 19980]